MKQTMKRGLAFLMALVMCLSLLPVLHFNADAATVNYVKGTVGSFTDVIANWGTRGETATFLSPNAEAFYTETTYSDLADLDGGTGTSDAYTSELYDALQTLMTNAHEKKTTESETKSLLFSYTDCQNSDTSSISSFYSGAEVGPEWDQGQTWNREHTWPDSKCISGSSDDGSDMMMLRPTAKSENSSRGNTAYGESSSYYDPNDESNGTYNLHGDVARIVLYVYVRWGNTDKMWGTSGVMESLDVLLRWIEEDPVDTWEMGRNDSVESITGTRNVFVDYPELAFTLFGAEIPADMDTPSGEAASSSYTITATVNNSAYGSASVSGKYINAAPADGYYASGYQVVSGTATVTQNGNAFKVEAASDCTVQIIFTQKDSFAVTYSQNGAVTTQTVWAGDSVLAEAGTVPEGYNFAGWVTAPVAQTTEKPETVYAAGATYTFDSDVTFYALYSRLDKEASGTSASIFEPYSGTLTEGDYLVVYGGGAMKAAVSENRMQYADVEIVDNAIVCTDASLVWHIASDGTYYTLYNESMSQYAAGTGAKNKAKLESSVTDHSRWTVSGTETYEFVNKGNAASGVNSNLRRNASFGFACYSTSTGGALSLYKAVSGVLYYSTSTGEGCAHASARDVAAVAPTCTGSGYTAGVYCDDCLSYVSGHILVMPAGHDYSSAIVDKTITYTCTACGDTYSENYYPVVFSVPDGITAPAAVNGANGVELPTADAPEGWTFLGWTENIVENETDEPTYLKAGTTFTAADTDILYALYSQGEGISEVTYNLVTSAPADWTGEYVLTSANAAQILRTDTTSPGDTTAVAQLADTGMVLSNGALHNVSDNYVLVIEAVGSSYSLRLKGVSGSYYLKTTNSNNGFGTATSASGNALWTISIESGIVNIFNASNTTREIQYNSNNKMFRAYASTQKDIYLYAKAESAGSSTVYTTVFEGGCVHDDLHTVSYVAPTCTEPGRRVGLECNVCGALLGGGEVIPATGHSSSYVDNGDGTHDYICATCQTVEKDNEGHSFADGTCVCGAVESTEGAYASELTLKSVNLDLGSAITMNFNGLAAVFTQYEDVYVLYQAEGKEDVIVRAYYESSSGDDLRHNFAYDGLTALDLGLEVYATVYGTKDGVVYHGDTKSYSLLKFCTTSICNGDNDAAACANLLLYGNAAQVYKSVAEEEQVLNQLTEEQLALVEQYAYSDDAVQVEKTSVVAQENAQVKFVSQSLDMLSRIALVFKISTADYTGQLDAITFRITYTDAYGTEQVKNYTMEDLMVVDAAAGIYELYFSEFYSTQMRQLALCEIYVDGQLHASYQNSIENYCYTALNNDSESEALKALVRRISLYGDAAYNTYAS